MKSNYAIKVVFGRINVSNGMMPVMTRSEEIVKRTSNETQNQSENQLEGFSYLIVLHLLLFFLQTIAIQYIHFAHCGDQTIN